MARWTAALWLLVCAALSAGCASTTSEGAVGGSRKQLLLVSSSQMDQISAQAYDKLKEEGRADGTLNRDPALLRRVQGIAARLIPQTAVFRADAPGWPWEVNVIDDEQINAFCMPGGKIVVYSGLAKGLGLSDDEIAVVLGHEISHALREHSREQVSQKIAAKAAISLGAAVFGLGQLSTELVDVGYQALLSTRFSRTDESEADRLGLELMARAGYDPRAGVSVWQKMMQADRGSRPPAFLSSHPTDESRVKAVEELLPKVLPLYEAAKH